MVTVGTGQSRSDAVMTECTPGRRSAGLTSIDLIRPCATWLRRTTAYNCPSFTTSSIYSPRPRRNRRSSTRSAGLPIWRLVATLVLARFAIGGAGIEHRLDDRDIAGAAAEIAGQHVAHAVRIRIRLFAQERVRGRDHAGCAEAALQRAMFAERGLERRQRFVVAQPFDRDDLGSLGLNGKHQTGSHRIAIDDNRASTADTVLATEMRSGEPQLLAQAIGKRHARRHRDIDPLAVDPETNLERRLRHVPPPIARSSARSVSVPARARRYSALAWMSSGGATAADTARPASTISASLTTRPLRTVSACLIRSGRLAAPMTQICTSFARPSPSSS